MDFKRYHYVIIYIYIYQYLIIRFIKFYLLEMKYGNPYNINSRIKNLQILRQPRYKDTELDKTIEYEIYSKLQRNNVGINPNRWKLIKRDDS